MKIIIHLMITTIIVFVLAHFLNGIKVDNFGTAILVAIVIGLLNTFLKPILVFLTLPVTILTLGLFLLVINTGMVIICAELIPQFHVNSFWTAMLFSILLSISQSILYKAVDRK